MTFEELTEKEKPKAIKLDHGWDGKSTFYHCPSCQEAVATERDDDHKYCQWCGQRIDWAGHAYPRWARQDINLI